MSMMSEHTDALYDAMCAHYAKSSPESHRRYQMVMRAARDRLGRERAIECAKAAYARWREANFGVAA